MPGATAFAYVVGIALIVGGIAILTEGSRRLGAAILAVVYSIFTIFWLPRLLTAPRILGYHPDVYFGVFAGVCLYLICVAAALLVRGAPLAPNRWVFGISALAFGLAHLTNVATNAPLVPAWLPPTRDFWVVLTGIAFVLSGIGMLTRFAGIAAARLLALMLFVFSVLALAPLIVKYPHGQIAWGANAYNLTAVAAVWLFAQYLANDRRSSEGSAATKP